MDNKCTVTDGTFHSAITGTFQSDTGGTSIPLLSDDPHPGKDRHRHQHNKQNLQTRHKIQHTPVIMINNKDSGTILPSNLRTGQEIRIFYCKFRAEYKKLRVSNCTLKWKKIALIQYAVK